MKKESNKPRVFLVCSGLGRINRGYESFTRECFEVLKSSTDFDLYLLKGGGNSEGREIVVANIPRQSKLAARVGALIKKEAYYIEQLSFVIALLPVLIRKKPAVIYFSDFILGTFLWQLRRILGFKYKLLYSNGAPNGPPFSRCDHVQQLLPAHLEIALNGGTPPDMQTLLPYAIVINLQERLNLLANKSIDLREKLNLPGNKKIILSVGALNSSHKRMDYIISEVAMLDDSYFLVLLGQQDTETASILSLAEQKLKGRFLMTTVPHDEIKDFYAAADIFILGSLKEGLPRVLPEALSYGLPCFVHDYALTRQTLNKFGYYADFTAESALANELKLFTDSPGLKEERVRYSYETYSWEMLKSEYHKMIERNID